MFVVSPSGDIARKRFSAFLDHTRDLDIVTGIQRSRGRERLTFGDYASVHFVTRRSLSFVRGWSLDFAVVDNDITTEQLEHLEPAFATTGGRIVRITDGDALWD